MTKYATIAELAYSLGVAPSTVSRALSDHPRIGKKTKERIWKKVKESGFIPNFYSQVLKDNKTNLIGVIVPDLTLHFYSRVLSAIDSELKCNNYSILLGHSEEKCDVEKEIVNMFINRRVDAVIAALAKDSSHLDHFERLIDLGIPLILYDRVTHFLNTTRIISDDLKAAYKATEYLIHSGCRKIAHIAASKNLNNSNNRLYGYLDALQDNGIEINEDLIHYFEFDHATIHKFLNQTLMEHPDLDGIFVFNDYAASTAAQYLIRNGIKIPDQISLIGFSDEPIATNMTPQLSTVEDIASIMGKKAAQAAISKIYLPSTEDSSGEKIILDQKLVLKGTTKTLGVLAM